MTEKKQKVHVPVFWKDFTAGYISGIVNTMAGQPFDNCKIKMVGSGKSLLWTFQNTIKVEGVRSLWKGSTFPLITFGFCNSIIFSANEGVKYHFKKNSNDGKLKAWHFFIAGGASGLSNSIISAPMEHLRIRMQNDVGNALYKGSIDCFNKIFRSHGLLGLYKGFSVTVVREFFLYGSYFAAYEVLRQWGNRNDTLFMMTIGGLAGISGWMGGFSFDNIKTRLQTDSFDNPVYKTWADVRKVIKYSEIMKGFSAGFIRGFPVNAATFYSFELSMNAFYRDRK